MKKQLINVFTVRTALALLLLAIGLSASVFLVNRKTRFFTKADTSNTPVVKKVQLIIFNPILESYENKRLTDFKKWYYPDLLSREIINDVRDVSNGFVNYQIAERKEIDGYGKKIDGYEFTDEAYHTCLSDFSACHQPEQIDYKKILTDNQSCEKLNNGVIDEVWLWGGPQFGYGEGAAAGPNADIFNNQLGALPITGTSCKKLLVVLGFSYERGITEAMETYGHRIEAFMTKIYGGWNMKSGNSAWDIFTRRDINVPGQAQCGNVHFPPNSSADYDWSNARTVDSACDDWLSYPNIPSTPNVKNTSCSAWNCDGHQYLKWWMQHIPKAEGTGLDGKLNNWWKYIVDWNNSSSATNPVQEKTFDDSDSKIVYKGAWSVYSATGPYNGSIRYSTSPGQSIRFPFAGQGVKVVYTGNANKGKVHINIDNTAAGILDEYTQDLAWQQTWTYGGTLSPGNHIIELIHAEGAVVDLDAIIVTSSTGSVNPPPYDIALACSLAKRLSNLLGCKESISSSECAATITLINSLCE